MQHATRTAGGPVISWPSRAVCAAALLAGAIAFFQVLASLGVTTGSAPALPASGVVMPQDAAYRSATSALLHRSTPVRLAELTVRGDSGAVSMRRARPGEPGFLSSYLNPGVLSVLARATGASATSAIAIRELRLRPDGHGRQMWQLAGTQDGRPWRATVRPNGTGLRRVG